MTQTIGVIGNGVLGKAVARGFTEHAEVRVFDVIPELSTHHYLGDVATCDIVFLCLPTPAKDDGRCNTLVIDDFLRTAAHEGWWKQDSCYVIRSTVPIGYTKEWSKRYKHRKPLFHSPEFLTARCSLIDFQIPSRNIIGVPDDIRTYSDEGEICAEAYSRLEELYSHRFPGTPVLRMSSTESELVKLACNSFFAAKVTMFNLFADLAAAHDLCWEKVRGAILADGRIAHAHTTVPGPDGHLGYGGTCLPKDISNLLHCCYDAGVQAGPLKATIDRNTLRSREDA